MAGTPTTPSAAQPSAPRSSAGRATPVLLPQDALAGQPAVPLDRAVTTVGSSETCRLNLLSRTVSRSHAVFLVDGTTTAVADLASRTGVLVNGRAVREAELNAGDRVQIGKFAFRYRDADAASRATAAPVPPAPAAAAVVAGLLAVPLPGRVALIGRRETCDVALVGDPAVSAAHAALFHAGGQWYVRDLGSRTGTTVNGESVIQHAVHFGDRITVGAATILFAPAAAVAGHTVAGTGPAVQEVPAPIPSHLPADAEPDPFPLADELSPIELPPMELPAIPFGMAAAAAEPVEADVTTTEPVAVEDVAVPEPAGLGLDETARHAAVAYEVADAAPPIDIEPAATEPVATAVDDAPWLGHAGLPLDEITPDAPAHEAANASLAIGVAAEVEPVPTDADEGTPPGQAGLRPQVVSDAPTPATDRSPAVAEPLELKPIPLAEESAGVPAAPEALPEPWDGAADVVPPADAVADVVDVVEPTEPLPESALEWDAPLAAQGDAPHALSPAAGADVLTDTQFGQQVDAFVAQTTGPLIEARAPNDAAVPPDQHAHSTDVGTHPSDVAPDPTELPAPAGSETPSPAPPSLPADAGRPVVPLPPPSPSAAPPALAAQAERIAASLPAGHATPPVTDLLADVSDFVFVPGEAAAAAEVPDLIFWGDPDLDAAAEAAVVAAPPPAAVAPEPSAESSISGESPPAPSPGTPGEGAGEGDFERQTISGSQSDPHPSPFPAPPQTDPGSYDAVTGPAGAEPVAPLTATALEPAPPAAELPEPAPFEAPERVEPTADTAEAAPGETTALTPPELAEAAPVETSELPPPLGSTPEPATLVPTGSTVPAAAERVAVEPLDAPADPAAVEPISGAAESPPVFDAEPAVMAADVAAVVDGDDGSTAPTPAVGEADPFSAPAESITEGAIAGSVATVNAEPAIAERDDTRAAIESNDQPTPTFGAAIQAEVAGEPAVAEAVGPAGHVDAALALTPAEDADPLAAWDEPAPLTPVEPIAFEDLLAGEVDSADGPPGDQWLTDDTVAAAVADVSAEPVDQLRSAVIATDLPGDPPYDEPAGFELDPVQDGAENLTDLDLLDLDLPPEGVAAGEPATAGAPAADDGWERVDLSDEPATAIALGEVVHGAGTLGAGMASGTAALTPVADFAALAGGAAISTFATVTDAALTESPAPAGTVAPADEGSISADLGRPTLAILDSPGSGPAGTEPPAGDDLALDRALPDWAEPTAATEPSGKNEPAHPFDTATAAAVTAAAVTDAPAADAAAVEDGLNFLAFEQPTIAVDSPPGNGPADLFAAVADTAVPPAGPELVETVTEPAATVEPEVGGAAELPGEVATTATVAGPGTASEQPLPEPPTAQAAPAPPADGPRMSGPSLFGFNFDGGSFLGGMPLSLSGPPAPLPPGGIMFDTPVAAVSPPDVSPPDVSPSAEAGAVVNVPPTDAEPSTTATGEVAESAARVRPVTPPRPGGPQPLGLTGLVNGTAGAAAAFAAPALAASAEPVVAPAGMVGGAPPRMVPPLPRPMPFAGPNGRPRTAEVFSQMAGPIGAEAFATRPRSADQYHIPDVDRSNPGTAGDRAGDAARAEGTAYAPPPGYGLANDERLNPPDLRRRTKVRLLLAAVVIAPLAWVAGVYTNVPKTATVVGMLRYDGLSGQGESAQRLFHRDQVSALCGDTVRATARDLLVHRGKPAGPTEDGTTMSQAIQDQLSWQWTPDELKLTYRAPDGDDGKAQVEALLSTLRGTDDALAEARARAVHELDDAKAATAAAKADADALKAQWRQQTQLAQDRPDRATIDALDQASTAAAQRLAQVRAERAANESALAELQRQDPSKPVNVNADPEVDGLQRQLQPIQAQIAKAKQLAAMTGGATTQPGTGDDDPLLALLQQQAEKLTAELDHRQAELARDAAIPPEERARERESAIESLSVKLTDLRRAEADAAAAAAATATAAGDAHAKKESASLAEARAANLYNDQENADLKLRQASDDQAEKQRAADATVTVAGSASTNPDVAVVAQSDPRPLAAGVGALVLVAAFGFWLMAVAGSGEDGPGAPGDAEPVAAEREPAADDQAHQPVGV